MALTGKPYRDASRPPRGGHTYVLHCGNLDSEEAVRNLEGIWEVIAKLPRWHGGDDPEWPSDTELEGSFPASFVKALANSSGQTLGDWIDTAYEREFEVWNIQSAPGLVKLDLATESDPLDLSCIETLVEACGCKVVYSGLWVDESEAKRMAGAGRDGTQT